MTIINEPFKYPNLAECEPTKICNIAHELAKKSANVSINNSINEGSLPDIYALAMFCYEDRSEAAILNCRLLISDEFENEALAIHRHIFFDGRDCRVIAISFFGFVEPESKDLSPSQLLLTIVLSGKDNCIMAISQSHILETFSEYPDSLDTIDLPNSVGIGMINACLKSNSKIHDLNSGNATLKEDVSLKDANKRKDTSEQDYSFEYVGKLKGYRITYCNNYEDDKLIVPKELDDGEHGLLKVKAIGDDAFAYSSAKAIMLPSTILEIGEGAFQGCLFSTFAIPDSVRRIGFQAFDSCDSLKRLTIGKNVNYMNDPFDFCEKLKNIYYKGTKEQWDRISAGVNFECEVVIHCEDGEVHL